MVKEAMKAEAMLVALEDAEEERKERLLNLLGRLIMEKKISIIAMGKTYEGTNDELRIIAKELLAEATHGDKEAYKAASIILEEINGVASEQ